MSNFQSYNVIVCDHPWSFSDQLKQSSVKRGASSNYLTMSIDDIKNMKIKDLADPNGAVLAMWVPSSLLIEGLDIMKHYGFHYKQNYIWVKTKKEPLEEVSSVINKSIKIATKISSISDLKSSLKDLSVAAADTIHNLDFSSLLGFGMGHLFRQTHEICIIGINNNKIYKKLQNKSQRSVSLATNLKHSQKPEHLQDSFDLMFDQNCKKIELFSRRQRPGWDCIGNQAPNTIGQDINISIENLIK